MTVVRGLPALSQPVRMHCSSPKAIPRGMHAAIQTASACDVAAGAAPWEAKASRAIRLPPADA
jgi:hypothetical protein